MIGCLSCAAVLIRKLLDKAIQQRSFNESIAWSSSKTIKIPQLPLAFQCHMCPARFASKQALAAHSFQRHNTISPTRALLDVTHCPACLMEFHSRSRVIAHVNEKLKRCRRAIHSWLRPLDADIVAQLDKHEAELARSLSRIGRSRVYADAPACRLEGPLLSAAVEFPTMRVDNGP